jgi:hypothetical protein
MKDKINLIEETNRMRDLFGYKAGKVISEQLQSKQNQPNTPFPAYKPGTNNKVTNPVRPDTQPDQSYPNTPFPAYKPGTTNKIENPVQADSNTREQNIEAIYKSVGEDGIIHNPGSAQNNVKWVDYVNLYKISPSEINKLKEKTNVVPPKQIAQGQIPKELVNVNGIKKFQEWLNTQNPTWVNGKTLELNPKRGYGKFGPLTSASWDKLKDTYLKEIGSLQANQKVVANPELATVARAQGAQIGQTAAPAAGLTADQQTNLNRIGQQLQTPEQKRAAELAQRYGKK